MTMTTVNSFWIERRAKALSYLMTLHTKKCSQPYRTPEKRSYSPCLSLRSQGVASPVSFTATPRLLAVRRASSTCRESWVSSWTSVLLTLQAVATLEVLTWHMDTESKVTCTRYCSIWNSRGWLIGLSFGVEVWVRTLFWLMRRNRCRYL